MLTSNYSAEYGRASGGVINAITRSGGNEFHASLYEFLRNSAFDARNFFDGAAPPPFRRNQFGATLGGPIQKDKTFFFLNYEGLRQGLTNTAVDTVPSQAARNGNLCAPPNCSTPLFDSDANMESVTARLRDSGSRWPATPSAFRSGRLRARSIRGIGST